MKKEIITNKRLILNTATELFYQNGYEKTSFEKIAAACRITKPLITYHFKTKTLLASEVFDNYSSEMWLLFCSRTQDLFPEYNQLSLSAAYSLGQLQYYKDVPEAFHFYEGFFSSGIGIGIQGIESLINFSLSESHLSEIDKNIQHMYFIGSNYASRGLIYNYAAGNIRCSDKEFKKFFLQCNYRCYGLSEDEINIIQTEAEELLDKLTLLYLPNFRWQIMIKK
jgi:hypothetical protein